MMKNQWKFILLCIYVIAIFILFPNPEFKAVENMAIEIGSGFDVEKINGEYLKKIYRTVFEIDNKGKVSSYNFLGEGYSFGEVRENRQPKLDRETLNGLEKTYIISEEQGKLGIHGIIDIIFRNYLINDNGIMVVCKGNSFPIMEYKIKDYPSACDYINSLIQSADLFNFWGKDYTIETAYNTLDAEGKNLALPYIELDEDGIKIIGTAIFKGERLAAVLNIEDSRTMNLLRENTSEGLFSIIEKNKMILYYGKTKRTINCKKINGKYNFTIILNITGDIVENSMFEDINYNPKTISNFEKNLEQDTKIKCENFIQKMKKDYEVDMLQLGSVACAKYGRRSGVDWNKVINDSNIIVKVKVKVDKQGRGDY